MDVRATARYLPISPRKMRLVCDQVRGMDADQALTVLRFMPQKGARFVSKLIESAIANAETNFELNRRDLYVSYLVANEGPRLKRMKAGARGRYKPRLKRMSHLVVVLTERQEEEA
ncbi:MAG: 50S ribosomal protein L22 [Anaerolineae bacterium]|jgi:large subunit ribosomal protein L22|nr:MAG: 50S ribosomal protein L22 [Anaerolineae bacterium]